MDRQGAGLEDLEERVSTALDWIAELRTGTRIQSDAVFPEPFMDDHTEFDSFAAFCAESPWTLDDPNDVREVPRDRLDDYVAARTEFETWEGMKTQAAEERIVDRIRG